LNRRRQKEVVRSRMYYKKERTLQRKVLPSTEPPKGGRGGKAAPEENAPQTKQQGAHNLLKEASE